MLISYIHGFQEYQPIFFKTNVLCLWHMFWSLGAG